MPPLKRSKVVTAYDIKTSRIAFPAMVRKNVLGRVAPNSRTAMIMVDKNDNSHNVAIIVRNGNKQEIMANGERKFVRKRNLVARVILDFAQSDSPGQFKVTVQDRPLPGALSATLQPSILDQSSHHHVVNHTQPRCKQFSGSLHSQLNLKNNREQMAMEGLAFSIDLNRRPVDPPKPTHMAMEGSAFSINLNHAPVEPPKLTQMATELGPRFSINFNYAPVEHPPP